MWAPRLFTLTLTLLTLSSLHGIAKASDLAPHATYSLHSRYIAGGQRAQVWKYEGSIGLGPRADVSSTSDVSPTKDSISFVPANNRQDDLQPASDAGVLSIASDSSADGWLQLLLFEGDSKSVKQSDLANALFASTKLCLLPAPLVVTLHLPPATRNGSTKDGSHASLRPQSLSLHIEGVTTTALDASGCPAGQNNSPAGVINVPVRVAARRAAGAGAPPPRQPPRLKADGTPLGEGEEAPPVKEKSFVQKYWYYLLPVVILLAIPSELADSGNEGEAEEDDPPRLGGGSGGSGGGKKGAPAAGQVGTGAGMRRIR